MIPPGLLDQLHSILTRGEYNETGNTVFELRIRGSGVVTWDAQNRFADGTGQKPTCVIEFASIGPFAELVRGEKEFLELAALRQARIGGLFNDVVSFARLFQIKTRIPKESRLITLAAAKKREAESEILEKIKPLALRAEE